MKEAVFKAVCRCRSYDFPHRMGGGKCRRTKQYEPYCADCGSNAVWYNRDQECRECEDCRGADIVTP